MDKLPVIIVALEANRIEELLARLNFNAVLIVAMLVENGDQRSIAIGDTEIPTQPLYSIEEFLLRKTDFVWLLHGEGSDQLKNFLLSNEIPEDFIVDFNVQFNRRWLDAIQSIGDRDFFATGDACHVDGLNFDCIIGADGINLACKDQDLRQSFAIARHVFAHNHGVKFALIGLTPESLFAENADGFQYAFALKNFSDQSVQSQLIRQFFKPTFDRQSDESGEDFSAAALSTWQDTLDELTLERRAELFNRNLNALEDFIKLCLSNGAKPIVLILPYAPIIRSQYPKDQLAIFRQAISTLEKIYDFMSIDLFDLPLGYDCFADMTRLNPRGAQLISSLVNFKIHNRNLLPFGELSRVNYKDLYGLSALLMMDSYNNLLPRIFDTTIEKIRGREKIKLGFLLYDASMWCGDLLYQLFERSGRYEPTIFLCMRQDMIDEPNFVADFKKSAEQFRARGLNVVTVFEDDAPPPKQDVMICLMPYFEIMPKNFQLENMTAETLTCYIPYGMHVSGDARVPLTEYPIMTVAWKVFLDTRNTLEFYDNGCRFGLPRGFYSGYPRMDFFCSDDEKHFDWKEARPRSTKIIYAPHWSIDNGIQYSTFHLNGKFMYEYAKAHPKTSWVFKPHPNLAFSAVNSGMFRSLDEYNEYLQKWDRLPNARVITGGYYQPIFATSDGMILDSGSFNAEYQYTHKPLLFLTRETQQFTEIGGELMKVLYRADGRNHKSIAAFIDNVLIKKKDSMADVRKKFFDEHFNYVKHNGMLASEYIFHAIDKEMGGN